MKKKELEVVLSEIVKTPKPPYFAVIFTSIRTKDDNGYDSKSDEIVNIVSKQKGFLGAESVRDSDGFGMTVSYWDSLESINEWKKDIDHIEAKKTGKKVWYKEYMIRICEVKSQNYFQNPN